jgi:hypothetical protein
MLRSRYLLFTVSIAVVLPGFVSAAEPLAEPPYQIVLRSRGAQANPTKSKDAQTGGGTVLVEQPEPNTIVIAMTGAAVAGSEFHGSSAGIAFELDQALDIIPTRARLRPPRIAMVGKVVGTLQVTDPGHHCKACGLAEQSVGTASLVCGDAPVLSVIVKPSSAGPGTPVSVNNREGPVETIGAVGSYSLKQSFAISVFQTKGVFNRQYAVADFDPAPELDGFWADALKPFRAVARKDFGFRVILRVVEDSGAEVLGPPRRAGE